MKQARKELLLLSFPPLPGELYDEMINKKPKGLAENFVVFLTNGNELFARCYHRYCRGGLVERQRYVFAKDGCVRYTPDYETGWKIANKFREPSFYSNGSALRNSLCDNSYDILNQKAIKRSCMKYSKLEKYLKFGTLAIEYLHLYCRHPNLEYIVEAGFGEAILKENPHSFYVSSPPRSISIMEKINWKSNDLRKMLGLTSEEIKLLKGHEDNLLRFFTAFKNWRAAYPRLSAEDILQLAEHYSNVVYEPSDVEKTGIPPMRWLQYILSQDISYIEYSDHLRMCEQLDYDLHDTAISMPKNFREFHERCSQAIKYVHDKQAREEFEKNYAQRKRLEYENDKFMVRQPASIDDITAEGCALHHCVASYAQRHAKGVLHILFIRRKSEPDKPFYTMELGVNGVIQQVRGLRNKPATDDIEKFLEGYKEYLSEIFQKQKVRISA